MRDRDWGNVTGWSERQRLGKRDRLEIIDRDKGNMAGWSERQR